VENAPVPSLTRATLDSPIGPLGVEVAGEAIARIEFRPRRQADRTDRHSLVETLGRQLDEYFAGRRREFSLPLAPKGTEFQQTVWQALTKIPYGETISYADLARRIGKPAAVRAVGAANGQNPIPIVIPCHRVIGSNGKLVGFGGGLETKAFLLRLERGGLF
jgi:methylated-DNA-[protein]-cysteine S-methyltransferase